MPTPPVMLSPASAPLRPCTPVVSMRPQARAALVASVPMERTTQPRHEGTNPFWVPAPRATADAAAVPYALRPPRTPPRPLPQPGNDGPNTQAPPVGMPYAYSRAVLLGLNNQTPQSPSPGARAPVQAFAPFEALPVLWLTPESWAESCCTILQVPVAQLEEPVAVAVFEAVHVFEYADLKKWLLHSGHLKSRPPMFKNPANTSWTPLHDLRRVQPAATASDARA